MRYQIQKLTKARGTKSERRFMELLKQHRIQFQTKVRVCRREVDFLIGEYAIDIDCHEQDGSKNELLSANGYVPLHLSNREVRDREFVEKIIKSLWH